MVYKVQKEAMEILIESLIAWSKSSDKELLVKMQRSLKKHFEITYVNTGMSRDHTTERRIIVARDIVIHCISQLKKLDKLESKLLEVVKM